MSWRRKAKQRGWECGHDEMRGYFVVKAKTSDEYVKNNCPRIWLSDIDSSGYSVDNFFDLSDDELLSFSENKKLELKDKNVYYWSYGTINYNYTTESLLKIHHEKMLSLLSLINRVKDGYFEMCYYTDYQKIVVHPRVFSIFDDILGFEELVTGRGKLGDFEVISDKNCRNDRITINIGESTFTIVLLEADIWIDHIGINSNYMVKATVYTELLLDALKFNNRSEARNIIEILYDILESN